MTEEKKVPVLTRIQNELKAPKSQYNSYGKYRYRNAEDIMQGVKPLLLKYGASLYIEEDIVVIADRIVIVEKVMYEDEDGTKQIKGHAPVSHHKGMSDEQAWGAAASYASKYALGKLFLLDDSQDADTMPPADTMPGYQRRQTPQQKQLHDQATATTAKMEAMQLAKQLHDQATAKMEAKQEATNTIVDSKGTTLLQLFAEAMQAGKGSQKSQELEDWAHQSKENLTLVQRIAATGAWK